MGYKRRSFSFHIRTDNTKTWDTTGRFITNRHTVSHTTSYSIFIVVQLHCVHILLDMFLILVNSGVDEDKSSFSGLNLEHSLKVPKHAACNCAANYAAHKYPI